MKLPATIPCPRCATPLVLTVRREADALIVRVTVGCACGIRIDAAGSDMGDPLLAETGALASLRDAWRKTRDLWAAFCAVEENPAETVTVPEMERAIGNERRVLSKWARRQNGKP
jgi:hypothetical protein